MALAIARWLLRLLEGGCVRLANLGRRTPRVYRQHTVADLLKAQRIATFVSDGDHVLDVGCGNGHTLVEVGLFRRIRAKGLEIAPRTSFAGIDVQRYDGATLPFDSKSHDVVLLAYVLHHLEPDHARRLLSEALRVARRQVLLLEDSRPSFSPWYRLRNLLHRVEAGLEYRTQAPHYRSPAGDAMFKTHDGWVAWLSSFPDVREVSISSLEAISRYAHHTLIAIRV